MHLARTMVTYIVMHLARTMVTYIVMHLARTMVTFIVVHSHVHVQFVVQFKCNCIQTALSPLPINAIRVCNLGPLVLEFHYTSTSRMAMFGSGLNTI